MVLATAAKTAHDGVGTNPRERFTLQLILEEPV